MTEREIVTAVIKKTRKKGFILPVVYENIFDELDHGYCRMEELWWEGKGYYAIIFDPKFAKALWGEGNIEEDESAHNLSWYYDGAIGAHYDWQYFLQKMILAENKAEYLKEYT